MYKAPDQALYDDLYSAITKAGFKVYQFLPNEKAGYPFVVFGLIQIIPRSTRTRLLGNANVTLTVWGSSKQRSKVSEIANEIFNLCSNLSRERYQWYFNHDASSIEILQDNSTQNELWRAELNLAFKF